MSEVRPCLGEAAEFSLVMFFQQRRDYFGDNKGEFLVHRVGSKVLLLIFALGGAGRKFKTM